MRMAQLDKLNFHTVLRQSKRDEIAQSRNTLCGAAGAMMGADSQRIQQLNDAARQTLTGCRVSVTAGVRALDATDMILTMVRRYSAFTPDNDPHAEHDFGSFRFAGETIFWKFDYFDLDFSMHSLDASEPAVTARVLTILLGSEY
jgi:hypothetical protein